MRSATVIEMLGSEISKIEMPVYANASIGPPNGRGHSIRYPARKPTE
jgi:hypothetical protein